MSGILAFIWIVGILFTLGYAFGSGTEAKNLMIRDWALLVFAWPFLLGWVLSDGG